MTKSLKDLFEVYRPKAKDEADFVDKHVTIKHKDRNGNGDDVFKGNTKKADRKKERHGYESGEDEKVYEKYEVDPSLEDEHRKTSVTAARLKASRERYKINVPKKTNEEVELDERNKENKLKKDIQVVKAGQKEVAKGINFAKYQSGALADRKGHDYGLASHDDEDGESGGHASKKTAIRTYKVAGRKAMKEEVELDEINNPTVKSAPRGYGSPSKKSVSNGGTWASKNKDRGGNYEQPKIYASAMKKEEVEDLEELSRATIGRYSMKAKSIADNEGGKDRTKGRELAGRKRWGGTMKGVEKARVPSTNEEVNHLEEGTLKLSKVHIVHHHDHPAAKEFAKNYTAGMKGDHREGGPSEADEKSSNKFHERYHGVRTREGFAGGGTYVYHDRKTGGKWKVDRVPNGKTFYGTDHIISHHTGGLHEDVDQDIYFTEEEEMVIRSLAGAAEELGEELDLETLADIAEEVLSELSNKTLGSYIKKASNQAFSKGFTGGSMLSRGDYLKDKEEEKAGEKSTHKAIRRVSGISKAVNKLTKEDIINKAIETYIPEDVELPSLQERLVEKLDQHKLSEAHIHILLSVFDGLNEQNKTRMLDRVNTLEEVNSLLDFAISNRGD